ncbi:MAG: hypothetical protein LQ350_002240 [Teloschistes chrysophthalmus]|nr:MAG: hypothetical protein LQ350_002240 [Niorma chrysophthalma]
MPAKKGGGPRKGQVGKKAQIEKMVDAAKKTSPSVQYYPAKQDNGTKKPVPDPTIANHFVPKWRKRRDARLHPEPKKQDNTGEAVDNLSVATGPLPPCSPKSKSACTATIRLPGQDPMVSSTTKRIVHTRVFPFFTTTTNLTDTMAVVKFPPRTGKTFLDLAAETRNQIYELAMPRRKYHIQWIPRENRHPTELTYTWQIGLNFVGPGLTAEEGLRRRDFDLRNPWQKKQLSLRFRHPPGPTALLLVSKQINQEASGYFYGQNTFSFRAMRPLQEFLNTMRPETRSLIRSLQLIHHTGGDPELTEHQVFKDRYERCWDNLCRQVVDQCDQLSSLAVDLTIKDIPFFMGPRAKWMGPLYHFYGLDRLKHFNIRLHQFETEDTVLEVEAYNIRQALMTKENYYEPTAAMRRKPKPITCLRLEDVRTPPRPKKQPRERKKVVEEPNPLYMAQHPFDFTGRHKINGTGPYKFNLHFQ